MIFFLTLQTGSQYPVDKRNIKDVYISPNFNNRKKVQNYAFLKVCQKIFFCTLLAINPSEINPNQTSGRALKNSEYFEQDRH